LLPPQTRQVQLTALPPKSGLAGHLHIDVPHPLFLIGKIDVIIDGHKHRIAPHLTSGHLDGWAEFEDDAARWAHNDARLPIDLGHPIGLFLLKIEVLQKKAIYAMT